MFDLGDTLVNQNLEKYKIKRLGVFKGFGYNIPKRKLKAAFDETYKDFNRKYYGSPKRHRSRYRLEFVLNHLGYKPSKSLLLKMERVLHAMWFELDTLYPGVKSILAFCKNSGLKIALVCNGSTDTKKILNQLDIRKYFDYVVISEDVGYEKSDLIPFKLVLKKFSLMPSECLMVGNRADEDLKAGKLGIKTCLVEYFKFPNIGKPEKPDFKIDDIRKLKPIIKKLIKSS